MTRPTAAERLANPAAILTRSDLRALGWERRAVDAIFRELDPVFVPGYSRGAILVSDYQAALERWRHDGKTSVRNP